MDKIWLNSNTVESDNKIKIALGLGVSNGDTGVPVVEWQKCISQNGFISITYLHFIPFQLYAFLLCGKFFTDAIIQIKMLKNDNAITSEISLTKEFNILS